jgi:hypothetical protein
MANETKFALILSVILHFLEPYVDQDVWSTYGLRYTR